MNQVRLSNKLVRYEYQGKVYLSHWCPACEHAHTFVIGGGHSWTFDGNVEAPTFTPSMREFRRLKDGTEKTICHYVLTAGQIQYCGDSPHELSGKTVPLPEIPEDYGFGPTCFRDLPRA